MQRISSNVTLFLKIFIPTFWIVFFGIFTVAVWRLDVPYFGPVKAQTMKIGLTVFFLVGSGLLYLTLLQLKRVELDELHVYASNYFKTYRYTFDSVEKITERDMGLFHLVRIHLKAPGHFGKKLTFLLDEPMLKDFLEKNPEAAAQFEKLKIERRR
jgi:hypothetical protein